MENAERRKYPRLKTNYMARYASDDFEEYNYQVVTLSDISAGGALFSTEEKLNVRNKIDIEISLPGGAKTPLVAEVVRVKKIQRSAVDLYKTAVKFASDGIYEGSINYINNLVEKRLSPSE